MRLAMVVEYDGTDYRGWQIQPGDRTIQGELESALETVLRRRTRVEGAGRTDAGVHALGQVAAFAAADGVDLRTLERRLNGILAPAIAVHGLRTVPDTFDPRRDARARTYLYRIWAAPWASPFARRFAWHVYDALDVGSMAEAAAALEGEHDFSAFQAAGCDADNPVRRVLESAVERRGSEIVLRIAATAFLRHMVRAIAGTLVEIGRGRRRGADLSALLAGRDRTQAGPTAPPQGLVLARVDYDLPGLEPRPTPGLDA
jgi:tRNA pseudouridine38-40 synthase